MNRLKILTIAMISLCLTSCGSSVSEALDKFDRAIDEVKKMREAVRSISDDWRKQIDQVQAKLTEDAKVFVITLGIEGRCNVDFIEGKVLGYLVAVEEALVRKRDQIKKSGRLEGKPEEIIKKIIETSGQMPPHVCQVEPDTLTLEPTTAGTEENFKADKDINIYGYKLNRSHAESQQLKLFVLSQLGERELNSPNCLVINSDYKVLLKGDEIAKHLTRKDIKLIFKFGLEAITQVNLKFKEALIVQPQFKTINITIPNRDLVIPDRSTGHVIISETLTHSLTVGKDSKDLAIQIGHRSSDDLEGSILIKDNCKGIKIEILDSIDCNSVIRIQDHCEVHILSRSRAICRGPMGCKIFIGQNTSVTTNIDVQEFKQCIDLKTVGQGSTLNGQPLP